MSSVSILRLRFDEAGDRFTKQYAQRLFMRRIIYLHFFAHTVNDVFHVGKSKLRHGLLPELGRDSTALFSVDYWCHSVSVSNVIAIESVGELTASTSGSRDIGHAWLHCRDEVQRL